MSIAMGALGLVLLVQGLRGYTGSQRRWLNDRRWVSGWPWLGMAWWSLSPFSFALADVLYHVQGRASFLSALGIILFLALSIFGYAFTYVWMPRFLLPGWAKYPLQAGLDMTNLADLEYWEKLVGDGWTEREAADQVNATSVADGRRPSRITVNFTSEDRVEQFARLRASGVPLWPAAQQTGAGLRAKGLAVDVHGWFPASDAEVGDFEHPEITVRGKPVPKPGARHLVNRGEDCGGHA